MYPEMMVVGLTLASWLAGRRDTCFEAGIPFLEISYHQEKWYGSQTYRDIVADMGEAKARRTSEQVFPSSFAQVLFS